jgi:hypothetical protein
VGDTDIIRAPPEILLDDMACTVSYVHMTFGGLSAGARPASAPTAHTNFGSALRLCTDEMLQVYQGCDSEIGDMQCHESLFRLYP